MAGHLLQTLLYMLVSEGAESVRKTIVSFLSDLQHAF